MNWDTVVIRLDGIDLGWTDRRTLYHGGAEFLLRDQTRLKIWLENDVRGYPLLYAARNGMPLPGSGGDPVSMISVAAGFMVFAGLPQILIAIVLGNDGKPGNAMAFAVAGVALSLLGLFAMTHSFAAMVMGSILFFGETVFLIATMTRISDAVQDVVLLSIVAWIFLRGIGAAHHLDHVRLPVRRPPQAMRRE